MSADLIGLLRQRGEIELDGDGGLHFHGEAGRLYRWLDDALERIILAAGATAFVGADTIDRDILETADYFESFADGAIATSEEGTTYLPPAACYQVYPSMRDVRLDAGRHVCVAARCGRREVRTAEELGRLQRFRMREAVFVGSSDGHLRAFAAGGCGKKTCTALWDTNVGTPIATAPAVSDGRVVVTDTSGTLHAYGLP